MKPLKVVVAISVVVLLCGCATTRTHYLAQPERLAVRGVYVHPASKITLPESVAGFQRDAVLRYDAEGLDIGAAYNSPSALHPMAVTVYVYPAPSLVSIGSPADVVAGARAQLTQNEFENRKQEVLHAHPGARLIEQRDTTRTEAGQSYPGKFAVFEYEDVFAGSRIALHSELHLFCYVGGKWTVKYRFTHPKAVDAEKKIQEFMQSLRWYGADIQ